MRAGHIGDSTGFYEDGDGDAKWDLIRSISRRCITTYDTAGYFVPTIRVRNQRVAMSCVALYAELFGAAYNFRPTSGGFKSHAAVVDHITYLRQRGYERKRHCIVALVECAAMVDNSVPSDADILAAHESSCQQVAADACAIIFDRDERTRFMQEVRATVGGGAGHDLSCLLSGLWEGPCLPSHLRGRAVVANLPKII